MTFPLGGGLIGLLGLLFVIFNVNPLVLFLPGSLLPLLFLCAIYSWELDVGLAYRKVEKSFDLFID